MTDNLGDRMKSYEFAETERRFLAGVPVYARIDGRCFSSFTRGMDRPFDQRMSDAMIRTTADLVDKTDALIGYTQSDEISLAWFAAGPKSEIFFNGKIQKMVSVLAGLATACFTRAIMDVFPDRAEMLPHFDCRAFSLPHHEVANAFLWRELDATKNAISMAASAYYSAKQLHGKNGSEKQEMLFAKGINFNDYPAFFKRGTFLRRFTRERELSADEIDHIPAKHRPEPGATFLRSSVEPLNMPRFGSVINREAVIFDGADYEIIGEKSDEHLGLVA